MEDPGEATLQCPYDRAHTILASRMQFHLTRCRLQYPNQETAVCPFNSTHVMNRVELNLHAESCPDRGIVDRFVKQVGNTEVVPGLQSVKNVDLSGFSDECWDDEVLEESVVDRVKSAATEKGVLISKIGASKAERKLHRRSERERYQNVTSHPGDRDQAAQNALQNANVPKSQPQGPWTQSSGSFGPGSSDLDEGVASLSINTEPSIASKPNAWGKPIARNQDAVISAPSFGPSAGGPRQVSGRPKAHPWNRMTQPPPLTPPAAAAAAAAAMERPAPEIQGPPLPPSQGLGGSAPPPRGAWGRGIVFGGAAGGINPDDFPTLAPSTNRGGRRTRP